MKCKPVQWMCILILTVIFGGCSATIKTEVKNQKLVQESLQQFIDQKKILETLYQYTYNFDGKKPDKFAELFIENAVWEIFPRGAEKPRFSFTSREQLKDFVSKRFKTVLADRQTQHYLTNTVFLELTDDFARTQSAVLVVHKIKGEKQLKVINSTIYKDEFIKTKDGWKFSRHLAM
ncbi:nuclear transport factor 2 family protein [Desulfococcaceae bacterium HSG7]|nr:nuclear transport factor 2 family protein [Desulfococcaceae bacterium HSG7]